MDAHDDGYLEIDGVIVAFDKAKFLVRFIDEAREHIGSLNQGLLTLEKDPHDVETLNGVFRSAHTIKGSSRMMKLSVVTDVAHRLEDVLDAIRQGNLQLSKGLSTLLFKGVDAISAMLEEISRGTEVTIPTEKICEQLEMAAKGEGVAGNPAEIKHAPRSSQPVTDEEILVEECPSSSPPMSPEPQVVKIPKSVAREKTIRIGADKLDELTKLMGEIESSQSKLKHRLFDIREIEKLCTQNMERMSQIIERDDLSREEQRRTLIQTAQPIANKLKRLSSTLREDISVQVLLSNQLQNQSIKLRMLPLSTLFDTFHRTARDMAISFGKEVDFIVEGGETELDKKIIEKIGDPLLHMIRNSIDHGIKETKAGKIKLSAAYEGGNVLIILSDNGAGIPIAKIKEKALKKKLLDKAELDTMSDSEIIQLIFSPGFSTSDIITDISGRGVGMDVVKNNIIDTLKGAIQIETKTDKGTTFFIRLPLTMAIMQVLFFTVTDMAFGIPADFVDETLRISEADLIHVVGERAIRLREQIIPVVDMTTLLGLASKSRSDEECIKEDFLIAIVKLANERLGLIIDTLLDLDNLVMKPLPEHMKNVKMVSGVIISGKNEIVNVLHIPEIFKVAKEMKTGSGKTIMPTPEKERAHILLVDDSISTREIEKSILESYGYTVSIAEDGLAALKKAETFLFDLVITDVEMPNMDGFTLTKHLKNDEKYKDIPVILVTSRDSVADKKKGMSVGADAYIVKGTFEKTTLMDTVENLIG